MDVEEKGLPKRRSQKLRGALGLGDGVINPLPPTNKRLLPPQQDTIEDTVST